jgi:hypothetical protein
MAPFRIKKVKNRTRELFLTKFRKRKRRRVPKENLILDVEQSKVAQ